MVQNMASKTLLCRSCPSIFFDFRHFYCQNLSSYLCDFTNYLQNELLWQNLFLALSFISVRPQEDLRCPALNEEVVHSNEAKTSSTNRFLQLLIVKLEKTGNTNTLCLLSIVKVAKTNNTDTLFWLKFSSCQIQATQTNWLCQLPRWCGRQTTSQNLNEDLKRYCTVSKEAKMNNTNTSRIWQHNSKWGVAGQHSAEQSGQNKQHR